MKKFRRNMHIPRSMLVIVLVLMMAACGGTMIPAPNGLKWVVHDKVPDIFLTALDDGSVGDEFFYNIPTAASTGSTFLWGSIMMAVNGSGSDYLSDFGLTQSLDGRRWATTIPQSFMDVTVACGCLKISEFANERPLLLLGNGQKIRSFAHF